MAIDVAEKNQGSTGNATGWQLDYIARDPTGLETDIAIAEAVAEYAPDTITDPSGNALVQLDVRANRINATPAGTRGEFSVMYGLPEEGSPLAAGNSSATYEFNYQAPTAHIFYALSTTAYQASGT